MTNDIIINKKKNVIVNNDNCTGGNNSLKGHAWSQGSESSDEGSPLTNNETMNNTGLVLYY